MAPSLSRAGEQGCGCGVAGGPRSWASSSCPTPPRSTPWPEASLSPCGQPPRPARHEPQAALGWSLGNASLLKGSWAHVGAALEELSTEPADRSSGGATALSKQNSSDYFFYIFPSRELPCSLQVPNTDMLGRGCFLL